VPSSPSLKEKRKEKKKKYEIKRKIDKREIKC